jgi:hypothetical protein
MTSIRECVPVTRECQVPKRVNPNRSTNRPLEQTLLHSSIRPPRRIQEGSCFRERTITSSREAIHEGTAIRIAGDPTGLQSIRTCDALFSIDRWCKGEI